MKVIEKRKVTLGGLPQKIHIRSNDPTLPVLLFLHGGPGVVNRHSVMRDHTDLLDSFTLVGWDQRGTGGSFCGATEGTMTITQLTDDAAELVDWLCQRFEKDKIFVIGGSWGSVLGTFLAYRYPAKIAAFVGFGQMVDGTKNEELSYDFCLNEARSAGDDETIKQLRALGPPKNGVYREGLKGLMAQRKIMMRYGGYSPNQKKRSNWDAFIKPLLLSGEYTLPEIYGIIRGYRFSLNTMWPQVGGTDLTKSCPRFEVPYFILNGRLDHNTPASLVDGYFETIEAPHKELIWLEHSGHNPMGDEPELFKSTLREKLAEVARTERENGLRI
ncbi:MAG: alpha/beta hydrolase [Oscillospiraceae bacterium]|nr:alpha/beta hydrolase [Oscillospiraceae bacterium]